MIKIKKEEKLRAFRASFFGLPVVITRARLLVAVCSSWYAQAFGAALLTEKHAWLPV